MACLRETTPLEQRPLRSGFSTAHYLGLRTVRTITCLYLLRVVEALPFGTSICGTPDAVSFIKIIS